MAVACTALGMKGCAVSGQAEARSEEVQQLLRCATAPLLVLLLHQDALSRHALRWWKSRRVLQELEHTRAALARAGWSLDAKQRLTCVRCGCIADLNEWTVKRHLFKTSVACDFWRSIPRMANARRDSKRRRVHLDD